MIQMVIIFLSCVATVAAVSQVVLLIQQIRLKAGAFWIAYGIVQVLLSAFLTAYVWAAAMGVI